MFETATVESHLRNKFGLSARDMSVIRPMLRRENADMVMLLSEKEDGTAFTTYLSLWNSILSRRTDFETSRLAGLTDRQKKALRRGRLEFETRILDVWMGDYVDGLAHMLELDSVQAFYVERVFNIEQTQRLRLWAKNPTARISLDPEWGKLTAVRDECVVKILSPAQLRDYRSLVDPTMPLVGE
jgi:hypothetical protein